MPPRPSSSSKSTSNVPTSTALVGPVHEAPASPPEGKSQLVPVRERGPAVGVQADPAYLRLLTHPTAAKNAIILALPPFALVTVLALLAAGHPLLGVFAFFVSAGTEVLLVNGYPETWPSLWGIFSSKKVDLGMQDARAPRPTERPSEEGGAT